MSQVDKLYIAATGIITSVGFNTQMTAAAVNAGISAYAESDYANKNNDRMTAAFVPDDALPELSDKLQELPLKADEKRMIRLAHIALAEIEPSLPKESAVPLFLAGPENIPARKNPITPKLIQLIQIQSGFTIDIEASRYIAAGRAGVIKCIDLAMRYLSVSDTSYVLIGGVDSYHNLLLNGYLDIEGRILSRNASQGFSLGEGAGFLLLSKNPDDSNVPVVISEPAFSQEPGHLYSEAPHKGEALSQAVRQAIAHSAELVDEVYSSLNGEHHFAKELGVMSIRNAQQMKEGHNINHPADCYGEIGAATGAVLIALSAIKLQQQKVQRNYLVYCSSDMAERSAVCIKNRITA